MKPKKKPVPPLERHQNCQVEIRPSENAVHFAKYYCLDCKKHIAWVSKKDAEIIAL
jgi:hypothetical protein